MPGRLSRRSRSYPLVVRLRPAAPTQLSTGCPHLCIQEVRGPGTRWTSHARRRCWARPSRPVRGPSPGSRPPVGRQPISTGLIGGKVTAAYANSTMTRERHAVPRHQDSLGLRTGGVSALRFLTMGTCPRTLDRLLLCLLARLAAHVLRPPGTTAATTSFDSTGLTDQQTVASDIWRP